MIVRYPAVSRFRRGVGDEITPEPLPEPQAPGTSLFSSLDFSTWGIAEWGLVALGAYLIFSLIGDTVSTVGAVKKTVRKRRRRSQKRQSLLDELRAA